jgi:hypothetical protein
VEVNMQGTTEHTKSISHNLQSNCLKLFLNGKDKPFLKLKGYSSANTSDGVERYSIAKTPVGGKTWTYQVPRTHKPG